MIPIALLVVVILLNDRKPSPQSTLAPVTATSTPAAQTEAPMPTISKAPLKSLKLTIFVPDDDGNLHRKLIERPAQSPNPAVTESALTLLFKEAADIIPPGTRLTVPVRKEKEEPGGDGTYWEVSLNSKFFDSPNWRSEKITELAVNAIVQTARAGIRQDSKPTYPIRIKILSGGKPVSTLGEYDISQPFDSDDMAGGAAGNE